jgi:hypothetical protein
MVTLVFARPHCPGSFVRFTAAGAVIVGGCASMIVTDCVEVAVLFDPSVAVQVTMVMPTGKVTGALFVIVTVPQLSDAEGRPSAVFARARPQMLGSLFAVTGESVEMVGGCVSLMVTFCVAVRVLP